MKINSRCKKMRPESKSPIQIQPGGVGVEINLPACPEHAAVGGNIIFMVCTSVTAQRSGPPPWKNSCNQRCADSESGTRLINCKVFWFLSYMFVSACLCLGVLHKPVYLVLVSLCLLHNGVLLFSFPACSRSCASTW